MNILSKLGRVAAIAVAAGGASLGGVADADAQQCMRWNAGVDHCLIFFGQEYVDNPNVCPPLDELSFEDQGYYWTAWNLVKAGAAGASDVAAEARACAKHWESRGYSGDPVLEGGNCSMDCDGASAYDGLPLCGPGERIGPWGGLSFGVVQREPECEQLQLIGTPYASLASGSYGRGRQFADKTAIINKNRLPHGFGIPRSVTSDMGPPIDIWTTLNYRQDLAIDDDDLLPSPFLILPPPRPQDNDRYANIDHIIPRVDKRGCECGTNSPANALVISRVLNMGMSNNVKDEDRIAILRRYTNYNVIFGGP